MVKIEPQILKNIEKYINLVKKRNIKVDSAYLYGSFASGKNHEWSDIDLAVISKDFTGNRLVDIEKIFGIKMQTDDRISAIPLNPDSLDDMFIQSEVIGKGIKIV